jgi:ABC-type branched-subunit amino acid transport system substrate-binding protein
VATGTYERNTVAIAGGLDSVAAGEPQAVVMVGAYTGCSEFIKAAKKNPATKDAVFCNISFVGTKALSDSLGSDGEGVIISQVVPFPWDTSVPVVEQFHKDMKAAGSEDQICFISLEGYLAGLMFAEGLGNAGAEPTREGFLNSFASAGGFDLGGVGLKFGDTDNQGLDSVWLTVITNSGVQPIDSAAFASVTVD